MCINIIHVTTPNHMGSLYALFSPEASSQSIQEIFTFKIARSHELIYPSMIHEIRIGGTQAQIADDCLAVIDPNITPIGTATTQQWQ